MNKPKVIPLGLAGVVEITPLRFSDMRGAFSETYNRAAFQEIGITTAFVQDNQSLSHQRGTVRGLHFQIPPMQQAKLVRVLRGSIFDVAVDLRHRSATYKKSVGLVLDAQKANQLFIPAGFAHGFCTLEPDTEVLYKVDAPYSRDHERGLLWNDPALGIAWPIDPHEAVVLERDSTFPGILELGQYF